MLDQFISYLTYVVLAILGVIVLYFMFTTKKKKEKRRGSFDAGTKALFNALDSFFYEDSVGAIKYLKESATHFSEETMIHNLIADILSKKNPKKALDIHKALLFKHNLKEFEKNAIYLSVAKDFEKLGELQKALFSLEKISNEYHTKASLNFLISIEKRVGSFKHIFEHQKLLNKISNNEKDKNFDKLSLEIANYYLKKQDKENFKKSLDNVKKYWKNHYIYLFSNIILELLAKNSKKVLKNGQQFVKKFPENELLIRFTLLCFDEEEINNRIEGKYQKIFSFIFDDTTNLQKEEYKFIDKTTFLSEYLNLATKKENENEKLLDYLINNKVFETQTHKQIQEPTLIDKNSQPINIIFAKIDGDFK